MFSLTVWFSTNAIAPALEVERGYSQTDVAWLTIGVQLGFVLGTLIIAVTNLAVLMNARLLFPISAVLAGVTSVAFVFPPEAIAYAIALRVLTGAFLGDIPQE